MVYWPRQYSSSSTRLWRHSMGLRWGLLWEQWILKCWGKHERELSGLELWKVALKWRVWMLRARWKLMQWVNTMSESSRENRLISKGNTEETLVLFNLSGPRLTVKSDSSRDNTHSISKWPVWCLLRSFCSYCLWSSHPILFHWGKKYQYS